MESPVIVGIDYVKIAHYNKKCNNNKLYVGEFWYE